MRRVTITLSDEIEASLNAYIQQQRLSAPLTAIMEAALEEFLFLRDIRSNLSLIQISSPPTTRRTAPGCVQYRGG